MLLYSGVKCSQQGQVCRRCARLRALSRRARSPQGCPTARKPFLSALSGRCAFLLPCATKNLLMHGWYVLLHVALCALPLGLGFGLLRSLTLEVWFMFEDCDSVCKAWHAPVCQCIGLRFGILGEQRTMQPMNCPLPVVIPYQAVLGLL